MHPDPSFRLDADACRRIARETAFAHIFVSDPRGIGVIHAPCTLDDAGDLGFHCSGRNRVLPLLEDARALASFSPLNGYVSPNWYTSAAQVPTWNYVAVEAEGRIERLSRPALIAQVDALGDEHEARLAPKPVWTRNKVSVDSYDRMIDAIHGFVIHDEAWRGTAKLSQNKAAADRAGVCAAFDELGRHDLATAVRDAR